MKDLAPTVSVIVCTYNRPNLLPQALISVLHQTWEDFEVIVVDDGSDECIEPQLLTDQRLRVLRVEHAGIGAARQLGLQEARGRLVAYCDDDDIWSPQHLSTLCGYLETHPDVTLVYSDSIWPNGDVPFSFDYNGLHLAGENFIFCSNVVHRRDAAVSIGGFDVSLEAYEDWDLWLRMSRHYLLRHIPEVTVTAGWHSDGVSAQNPWQVWQTVYERHRERLAAEGIHDRHHDLRSLVGGTEPFDPTTWTNERRQLLWYAPTLLSTSYGAASKELMLAIARQGIDLAFAPVSTQLPNELKQFEQPNAKWNRLTFVLDYRSGVSRLPSERIVWCTMHESTEIPPGKVREINQVAELLYVPSRQNIEAFQACGVKTPVQLLHFGVNTAKFPFLNRRSQEVFTFGTYGVLTVRKGVDVLLQAFQDEFVGHRDVHLILKTTQTPMHWQGADDRIEILTGFYSHEALLSLLRRMDVFVLPSRAEGFGLCGLEAMATGLPLIATNWGGPSEYMSDTDSYPLNYRLIDIGGIEVHGGRYFGQWAEPDYEHLRALLRYVYDNREEAALKGRMASKRVHKNWTWDRAAQQIITEYDELVGIS